MTVFLGIAVAVLKGIGICLLVLLLVLLLLLLFLPVSLRVRYEADECQVAVLAGPLHHPLMGATNKGNSKRTNAKQTKEETKEERAAHKSAPPGSKAKKEESEGRPDFFQHRWEALRALGKSNPLALAERLLCHGAWLFNLLLRGMKVRHLTVYWPITGEDAAKTALCYGATITAANNLLVVLRRHMKIQADSLQMEADFTGEHTTKKLVAFDVKTTPGILLVIALRAVHRVWVDPALQPDAKAA